MVLREDPESKSQLSRSQGILIAITGTPGTGKSSLCSKLAPKIEAKILPIDRMVATKYHLGYDSKREAWIADLEGLRKCIHKLKRKYRLLLACSHLSHLLDPDLIILLRSQPEVLYSRLKSKGYSESKLRENLEAEILNVIADQVAESKVDHFQIDTSYLTPDQAAELALKYIRDWLNARGFQK